MDGGDEISAAASDKTFFYPAEIFTTPMDLINRCSNTNIFYRDFKVSKRTNEWVSGELETTASSSSSVVTVAAAEGDFIIHLFTLAKKGDLEVEEEEDCGWWWCELE